MTESLFTTRYASNDLSTVTARCLQYTAVDLGSVSEPAVSLAPAQADSSP